MAARSPEDPHPTGVTEIDREHALELRVVREIQAALLDGERDQALSLLERLEDFTNAHFLTEQLLMRLHAYPGYEAHQQEHDRLIAELQELIRNIASGAPLEPEREVGKLERWMLAHMETLDESLGQFLTQGGDPASGAL